MSQPEVPEVENAEASQEQPESGVRPAVRKPLGAYFLFLKAEKEKAESGSRLTNKQLSERWGALSDEERQVYNDLAKKSKERYDREMEELRQSHPEEFEEAERQGKGKKSKSIEGTALVLPMARVKKLVRLDPDVKSVSKEAVVLITKATEMFIAHLAGEGAKSAVQSKKKTVSIATIDTLIRTRSQLEFLRGLLPISSAESAAPKKHARSGESRPKVAKADKEAQGNGEEVEEKKKEEKEKAKRKRASTGKKDGGADKVPKITAFFQKRNDAEEAEE